MVTGGVSIVYLKTSLDTEETRRDDQLFSKNKRARVLYDSPT